MHEYATLLGAATERTLESDTKTYLFSIRVPDHDSDEVRLSDHVQRFLMFSLRTRRI